MISFLLSMIREDYLGEISMLLGRFPSQVQLQVYLMRLFSKGP